MTPEEKIAELHKEINAYKDALQRDNDPKFEDYIGELADGLIGYTKVVEAYIASSPTWEANKQMIENAARQLRYMATSFTSKANFVPIELKIKELEQQLAQAQAACAEMRDILEFCKHGMNLQVIARAQSIDCGKGWHSPQDWERLEAELNQMSRVADREIKLRAELGQQLANAKSDLETARWAIGSKDKQLSELIAHTEKLEADLTKARERHDTIAKAHKEMAELIDQNQSEWKAKVEKLHLRLSRLANQAAVLCVHCDDFKNGGLGAFATAREFTKDEIRLARETLGEQ